jgi:hypothetical protein
MVIFEKKSITKDVFRFYLHVLPENILILGKFSPIFIHIYWPMFCRIFRKAGFSSRILTKIRPWGATGAPISF